MLIIYGIKNCDTVKKALRWLDEHKVKYQFHDYKKSGISKEKLQKFEKDFGWEKLVNNRGTTFRKLSEDQKPKNSSQAIKIMQEQTSIIKRPIIESESISIIGFDVNEYQKLLKE